MFGHILIDRWRELVQWSDGVGAMPVLVAGSHF